MSKNSKKESRPKTAAQLIATLQSDPKYTARMQEQERTKRKSKEEYTLFSEPILKELEEVGFSVRSVGELRKGRRKYSAAIPILIRWLPRISYKPLKEDIVRTLSVPWARPEASLPLIKEFKRSSDSEGTGMRWTIANALEVVADDSVFDDLTDLLKNSEYGRAREMLALALGNMSSSRAVPVLLDLLDDEDLVGHAVMALGKLRAPEARNRLESLKEHPKEWVRAEVRRALSRMS